MRTVYLLSPARCSGRRAQLLLREEAEFELARRLRAPQGISLGEAFAFMSGLYFRGKLAYARAFARPPRGCPGALVIAPGGGLLDDEHTVRAADLRAMAAVQVDPDEPAYREPLERDARELARRLGAQGRAVLLGSIASDRYTGPLSAALGERLLFPREFVGRGDMSRGGLLLRQVDAARRLEYIPLAGATRRGPRPPRLAPRRP